MKYTMKSIFDGDTTTYHVYADGEKIRSFWYHDEAVEFLNKKRQEELDTPIVFKKQFSVGTLQNRIRREWVACLDSYEAGSQTWDDKVWAEKCCQRAYTFGQTIGELVNDDDMWYKVFTEDFCKEWGDVRTAFTIPREEFAESTFLMRGIANTMQKLYDME